MAFWLTGRPTKLYGAQSFSKSWKFLSQSKNFPHFTEKVHYRVHNCLPFVPILSQMNLLFTLPHEFLKIVFLILSSHLHLGLPSCPLSEVSPTKTPYVPPLSPTFFTCAVHLIWFDLIIRTILVWVQITKLCLAQFPSVASPFLFPRPKCLPQHSILEF